MGGFPTAASNVDFTRLAQACGYAAVFEAASTDELAAAIGQAGGGKGPALLVVRCAVGARADLGRPTTTPQENKQAFMQRLQL